jgi:ElaB/YqjD/DUF883 family membrane-anchored ribosome-binding protein
MAQTSYPPPSPKTAALQQAGLESTFTEPTERLREPLARRDTGVGEGMRAVTSNFKRALDGSLHDDPMATLATAAIVGFVLGAIWKA